MQRVPPTDALIHMHFPEALLIFPEEEGLRDGVGGCRDQVGRPEETQNPYLFSSLPGDTEDASLVPTEHTSFSGE